MQQNALQTNPERMLASRGREVAHRQRIPLSLPARAVERIASIVCTTPNIKRARTSKKKKDTTYRTDQKVLDGFENEDL